MIWSHHWGGKLKNRQINYKNKINCSIDVKDLLYLVINEYPSKYLCIIKWYGRNQKKQQLTNAMVKILKVQKNGFDSLYVEIYLKMDTFSQKFA